MRTNVFLSTLFAVTLVGGAALAEKPHDSSHAREPRAVENLRSHGDMVDKSYSAVDKGAVDRSAGSSASAGYGTKTAQNRTSVDRGASRVNCSESGADCSAPRGAGATQAAGLEAPASQHGYSVRAPAFMDKLLGSDRTNFNEAGEPTGMSAHAVARIWSHAGAARAGDGNGTAASSLSSQRQVARTEQQASSDRMSCNEGDECTMSSKAAKKDWAYNAIKAGTWKGPGAADAAAKAEHVASAQTPSSGTGAGARAITHQHDDDR